MGLENCCFKVINVFNRGSYVVQLLLGWMWGGVFTSISNDLYSNFWFSSGVMTQVPRSGSAHGNCTILITCSLLYSKATKLQPRSTGFEAGWCLGKFKENALNVHKSFIHKCMLTGILQVYSLSVSSLYMWFMFGYACFSLVYWVILFWLCL